MAPIERHGPCRALCAAMLCLWLALLLGAAARAAPSVAALQKAEPVLTSMTALSSLPGITGDCQPCAACPIAPAQSIHGFSGDAEGREELPRPWPEDETSVPAQTWFFEAGGLRLRWPVRIAFCRWLD